MLRISLKHGCIVPLWLPDGYSGRVLPLPVNRTVGEWDGSLRCVCCLAGRMTHPSVARNEAPVAQFKPQPLVLGHTVFSGVLLQFQGTGYPEQAAFFDAGFPEPAHHITPGPDLVILDPGPLSVPNAFPKGKHGVGVLIRAHSMPRLGRCPADGVELCHRSPFRPKAKFTQKMPEDRLPP